MNNLMKAQIILVPNADMFYDIKVVDEAVDNTPEEDFPLLVRVGDDRESTTSIPLSKLSEEGVTTLTKFSEKFDLPLVKEFDNVDHYQAAFRLVCAMSQLMDTVVQVKQLNKPDTERYSIKLTVSDAGVEIVTISHLIK